MKALLVALLSVFLLRNGGLGEEPAAEGKETLSISIVSFNDIIGDVPNVAEMRAAHGRNLSQMPAEALDQLRLKIPAKVLRLMIEAVPALEANGAPGFHAPEIFPPGLAEGLEGQGEVEVAERNIWEARKKLEALAKKLAKGPPGAPPGQRMLTVPRKWVDDFLVERNAMAMTAMDESEVKGGRVAVEKRADGIYTELGGMRIYRRVSAAEVPEIGPVYCAKFGPGGTWKLYQVINKPVTWLQANDAAEKMPIPPGLGVAKPGLTGHLVTLRTKEENDVVVQMAKGMLYFWIGLNDRRLEAGNDPSGPWEWTSGAPVSWRNWFGNEPDAGGASSPEDTFDRRTDEDGVVCLGTLSQQTPGQWKDFATGTLYSKNHRAPYVVEWDIDTPEPVAGAQQWQPEESKPKKPAGSQRK